MSTESEATAIAARVIELFEDDGAVFPSPAVKTDCQDSFKQIMIALIEYLDVNFERVP